MAESLDAVGLPREKRIVVPGNHDISRTALKPFVQMQKGTIAQLGSEEEFNNTVHILQETIASKTFQNYVEYEHKFARYSCCTSNLGGQGWELPGGLGVYCLNTALCSFGGISDSSGKPISDERSLMIDTRSLQRWLAETSCKTRVLVMHHPVSWLAEWAAVELEKTIAHDFQLVFSGHVHLSSSAFSTRGLGGNIHCVAPALFTRKNERLGYAIITLDENSNKVEVKYRELAQQNYKFVTGSSLSGTDGGISVFPWKIEAYTPYEQAPQLPIAKDTLSRLEEEFQAATAIFSSKRTLWVDRDLSSVVRLN